MIWATLCCQSLSEQCHRTPKSVSHLYFLRIICSDTQTIKSRSQIGTYQEISNKEVFQLDLCLRRIFLGLILKRINLHSQGEYYVCDLSLMTGSYHAKLSQLQIFSSCCGKQGVGPDINFFPAFCFK